MNGDQITAKEIYQHKLFDDDDVDEGCDNGKGKHNVYMFGFTWNCISNSMDSYPMYGETYVSKEKSCKKAERILFKI